MTVTWRSATQPVCLLLPRRSCSVSGCSSAPLAAGAVRDGKPASSCGAAGFRPTCPTCPTGSPRRSDVASPDCSCRCSLPGQVSTLGRSCVSSTAAENGFALSQSLDCGVFRASLSAAGGRSWHSVLLSNSSVIRLSPSQPTDFSTQAAPPETHLRRVHRIAREPMNPPQSA